MVAWRTAQILALLPARLTSVTNIGSMVATPGVAAIRSAAAESSWPTGLILTSSPWSPQEARLALVTPAARPSTANRVPTAKAMTTAVEILRRRRRATLRRPIWVVRGRNRTRRRSRSPASWPPTAEPLAVQRLAQRHPDGAADGG